LSSGATRECCHAGLDPASMTSWIADQVRNDKKPRALPVGFFVGLTIPSVFARTHPLGVLPLKSGD
jgi:hypothetical protein